MNIQMPKFVLCILVLSVGITGCTTESGRPDYKGAGSYREGILITLPFTDKTVRLHFQDVADHILRINDFVESQRDVVTGLRDAELALTSNRLSLVQQKIAAWGSLFLIATLVTGVLGMNFRDQPDLSWGSGFLVTASLILIICTPLYIFFRRREWV